MPYAENAARGDNMTVRERPILFSAPMVRAILEGRKTQTRRVVKPQPELPDMKNTGLYGVWNGKIQAEIETPSGAPQGLTYHPLCPYGKPGDQLWVRENFRMISFHETETYQAEMQEDKRLGGNPIKWQGERGSIAYKFCKKTFSPSIFMPRECSRIQLEITGVRVERLHDISEKDAMNEGADPAMDICTSTTDPRHYRVGFLRLWDLINGTASTHANPWVWVVEFERVKP